MSGDSNVAPVIIKRKKVVAGDGHHGGAWKVAYADFVTAMMAFFMLMWLLNATTEKQRKGIADYFSPTIAMARVSGGGSGALGGDSIFAENTLPRVGTGATSLRPQAERSKDDAFPSRDPQADGPETEEFKQVEELLMGRGGESMVADELLEHIVTEVTDEGLVIEFFETPRARLFDDEARPTALLEDLALILARASDVVKNPVAIEAHTTSYPVVLAKNPAWDISRDRAEVFRELVIARGLESQRVRRVTAYADREPKTENRLDPRNSRIEVVFLRGD
ncbi:flagellar motor protein MotB [Mameliella sediminis]|uniref:flagellar motor protein MotB n=1 Tax=Mameliella sediminis TaxID=2836866 RepID=UPI001C495FA8|nr:flagellar motor protein MotB [Mameliella sediminis]MBV7395330.1 chemotaxis protein MotB [Mameliella sediminis]MBY6114033.1 chemotaxis protein MotB [Antarctobacter heliothermus]MBY6142619.1 chemotaxis protein MotB [Mameliella alba]MCA0953656.1 OmpA family protein [Mameliella alba]